MVPQRGPRPRTARTDDSSSESGGDHSPGPAAIEEHLRAVDDDIGGFAATEPSLVSAEVRIPRMRVRVRGGWSV